MRAKDTLIIAGGLVFQQLAGFVVGVFVAKSLGATNYGSLTIARNFVTILLTLTPIGLDLALLKYLPTASGNRGFIFRQFSSFRGVAYLANMGLVLIIIALSPAMEAHLYKFDGFALIFAITVAALPFSTDINILATYYKSFEKLGIFSFFTSYGQTFLRSALNLAAIAFGFGVMGVAVSGTVSVLLAVASISLHLHHWQGRSAAQSAEPATRDWGEIKSVFHESYWMAMNLFISGLTRSVDVLILGLFVTAHEVGSYGALSLIAYIVSVYPIALSQTLGPNVARLYAQGDLVGINFALSRYMRQASMIASFIFAGVAAFGERLDLILGKSFHISPYLALFLPLGYYVSALLAPNGYALSMTGRHKLELSVLAVGGGCLVGLLFTLTPGFGAVGAAFAVLIAFVFMNIVRFVLVVRHIGYLPLKLIDLVPPVVALALAVGGRMVAKTLGDMSLLHIIFGCVLYALSYGSFLFFLFMNGEERHHILGMLRRRGRVA